MNNVNVFGCSSGLLRGPSWSAPERGFGPSWVELCDLGGPPDPIQGSGSLN